MTGPIAAGTLLHLEAGEYSDRRTIGHVRALKPIDAEAWREMRAACSDGEWGYFDDDRALPWLIAQGYVEEIDVTTVALDEHWEHA